MEKMEKNTFAQRHDAYCLRTSCEIADLAEREWRDLVILPNRLWNTSKPFPKRREAAQRFKKLLQEEKAKSETQSFSTRAIAVIIQELVREELIPVELVKGQLQNLNIANSADRKTAIKLLEENLEDAAA